MKPKIESAKNFNSSYSSSSSISKITFAVNISVAVKIYLLIIFMIEFPKAVTKNGQSQFSK